MTDAQDNDAYLIGQVKWFNNKAGYGFITQMEGEHTGSDIFVHHSAIKVSEEQFKYLVQGEYVHFKKVKSSTDNHEYQVGEVKGMSSGKLMCETRNAQRASSLNSPSNEDGASSGQERMVNRGGRGGGGRGGGRGGRQNMRVRGPGPRDGMPLLDPANGEEWMLVKRRKPNVAQTSTSTSPSPSTSTSLSREPSTPTFNA